MSRFDQGKQTQINSTSQDLNASSLGWCWLVQTGSNWKTSVHDIKGNSVACCAHLIWDFIKAGCVIQIRVD